MSDDQRRALSFTKMQGTGNDFLVIDTRTQELSDDVLSDLAARWCPRRFGVGADGLLALAPATEADADYRMRYFNADGSRATMCGNGARCLARFAYRRGIRKRLLRFQSDAGRYRARLLEEPDGAVRLYAGAPRETVLNRTPAGGLPGPLDAVDYAWTGTGHWVARTDALEDAPVATWGARLRQDESVAPEGANANFVRLEGDDLHVRTFEKGVEAETLSCGTGVLAAASVAWKRGWTGADPVVVHTRGGTLRVGRDEPNGGGEEGDSSLYLEGPAEVVYRGRIDEAVPSDA